MYVNIQKSLARQAENHKTARHSAGDQLTGFDIAFEYDDRESFFSRLPFSASTNSLVDEDSSGRKVDCELA
jgi:hypothetical protein